VGGNATKTSEMLEVAFWREDISFEKLSKLDTLGCPLLITTNETVYQVKEVGL
jgi:hypothetical protein